MAFPFLTDLDLGLNQLLNAVLDSLATDPSSPADAQIWFNTGSGRIKFHDGTAVQFVVSPSSTDTLTNKSINADNNTVSNLAVANFASSALSTDLSTGTSSQLATADVIWTAINSAVATANAFVLKGDLDCSTNPNYPAANAGEAYLISVAGKIGGASGLGVEAGDLAVCKTDLTASGNHATVGSDWFIVQRNLEAASTTVVGFVRLATGAETQTGTASDIAVTPAGLASVGYRKTYVATITNSSGSTITAATHGLAVNNTLSAEFWEDGTPPKKAVVDLEIDFSTGAVTWAANKTVSGYLQITG